jgi:hypothetical protein
MARADTGMMRTAHIALGVGLVILWIAGLANHSTSWMTWLDGLAGLVALAGAATAGRDARGGQWTSAGLTVGLFALWIIGLSAHASRPLSWWNFAFACAFLLVAVTAGSWRGIGELRPTGA